MKRIISFILLSALILCCISSLVSCGTPNPDAEKAEANLKAEGYIVVTFPVGGKVGIERSFTATKYDENENAVEWIQIFYITDIADDVYDYIEGLFKEKEEEESNKDRKIEFGKKTGVIWFGTTNAVKDSQ